MKFAKNEGKMDRVIRIVVGVLLLAGGYLFLHDIMMWISMIVGLILLVTGLSGFCGLYSVLGMNTCEMKKEEKA